MNASLNALKTISPNTKFRVDDIGLKGVTNGELLREAVNHHFDTLITVDQNILLQQICRGLIWL